MDTILRDTVADQRLSRSENKALRGVVRDGGLVATDLSRFRARAFMLAHELSHGGQPTPELLDWLEDVLKALTPKTQVPRLDARFSPGEACLNAILSEVGNARDNIDVCVFTITDDRISDALVAAHRKGVGVRVITDNDKAYDRGSDIDKLRDARIAVRVDDTDAHMHHKFAIFDGETVLTGSYNWTRSAARDNQENLLVTEHPRAVRAFRSQFDRLWDRFAP
jgi:phosphatidylserine/phosphatidylglycerophosphate/cardiolipin synthase-like enzyme